MNIRKGDTRRKRREVIRAKAKKNGGNIRNGKVKGIKLERGRLRFKVGRTED